MCGTWCVGQGHTFAILKALIKMINVILSEFKSLLCVVRTFSMTAVLSQQTVSIRCAIVHCRPNVQGLWTCSSCRTVTHTHQTLALTLLLLLPALSHPPPSYLFLTIAFCFKIDVMTTISQIRVSHGWIKGATQTLAQVQTLYVYLSGLLTISMAMLEPQSFASLRVLRFHTDCLLSQPWTVTVESSSIQEDAHTLQPNSIHQLILPCLHLL